MACALGEDILAASDPDQLRHPAHRTDRRLVPLLEIDPRSPRQRSSLRTHRRHRRLELLDQGQRAILRSDQAAQRLDHRQDAVHAALVEHMHRHARLDQVARHVGLHVGKTQHQVGIDREDLLQVAAGEGKHLGLLLARARRDHGVTRDARNTGFLAQGVEDFDGFGGEADDAGGEAACFHAPIILHLRALAGAAPTANLPTQTARPCRSRPSQDAEVPEQPPGQRHTQPPVDAHRL